MRISSHGPQRPRHNGVAVYIFIFVWQKNNFADINALTVYNIYQQNNIYAFYPRAELVMYFISTIYSLLKYQGLDTKNSQLPKCPNIKLPKFPNMQNCPQYGDTKNSQYILTYWHGFSQYIQQSDGHLNVLHLHVLPLWQGMGYYVVHSNQHQLGIQRSQVVKDGF